MPIYKVVLQIDTSHDEAGLRRALARLATAPPAGLEDGHTLKADILAIAETQASRTEREPPTGGH